MIRHEEEIEDLKTRLNGVERELGQLSTNFEVRIRALEKHKKRAGRLANSPEKKT